MNGASLIPATMLNLANTIRLLKKERDEARMTASRLDRALKELNRLAGGKRIGKGSIGRTMSVQARKRIAAARESVGPTGKRRRVKIPESRHRNPQYRGTESKTKHRMLNRGAAMCQWWAGA